MAIIDPYRLQVFFATLDGPTTAVLFAANVSEAPNAFVAPEGTPPMMSANVVPEVYTPIIGQPTIPTFTANVSRGA